MRLDPLPLWLALVVGAATLAPARGLLAEALPVLSAAAVVTILFLTGLRLSRAALVAGIAHWRLHLLVTALTFVAFPLVVLALRWAAPGALPPPLWGGLLFLAAVPSTVQSAIAFTALAGGNVAAAVCAATISNLGAVALTPWLAVWLTGSGAAAGAGGIELTGSHVLRVLGLVVLPTLAGQLARPWLGAWAETRGALLRRADRAAILLVVYAAFSAAVAAGLWSLVPPDRLLVLALADLVLLAAVGLLAWALGGTGPFTQADRRAILFIGTTKSLATGTPIAGVLMPPALVGATLLPLMLYHPLQSLLGSVLASRWAGRAGA